MKPCCPRPCQAGPVFDKRSRSRNYRRPPPGRARAGEAGLTTGICVPERGQASTWLATPCQLARRAARDLLDRGLRVGGFTCWAPGSYEVDVFVLCQADVDPSAADRPRATRSLG